ncbi:hypothetical protein BVC71_04180 [Marivivens niveibacter]|uniref:Amidohydrolase-related domain-containing protein n=1 Tax=Marivivens niveibacter TaxID=1930667 RepID=A0A251X1T7_9RHOB|nr:amidohydrolase family protein [Marivivens niveibacter]OUD10690.1 hypothetical protein BVC71_04180 [Marivivens niveibacter]
MLRRRFMSGATAALGLSACAPLPEYEINRTTTLCATTPHPDGMLRVDMHNHIMNLRDGDAMEFLRRREELNADIPFNTDTIRFMLAPYTRPLNSEINDLEAVIDANMDIAGFCATASDRQKTSLPNFQTRPAEDEPLGFMRNRMRNAALLIASAPQIDLFITSMVDMYEVHGEVDFYDPHKQRLFYSKLALATKGRILPFVSFQPERAAEQTYNDDYTIDFVRSAILEHGFLGVKIHPSVGIDPLDNTNFGCRNTSSPDELDGVWGEQDGPYIQKQMDLLYDLCHELDVPLLTHHGTGILANPTCQLRGDNPDDWTNSTHHWIQLMERLEQTHPNFRVCLGHLSGGFEFEQGTLREHPWFSCTTQYILERLTAGDPCNIWLDTSAHAELFEDTEEAEQLKTAIADFIKTNPKIADRMIYGSDWHMPSGLAKDYAHSMEGILPRSKQDIMGHNAIKFLGLNKPATLGRLEKFFGQINLPLSNIPWFRKMERDGLI